MGEDAKDRDKRKDGRGDNVWGVSFSGMGRQQAEVGRTCSRFFFSEHIVANFARRVLGGR
eukprot:239368-Amorphochlora_amoeboformis.AAC.1